MFDSVPRHSFDLLKEDRDHWRTLAGQLQEKNHVLTEQIVDIKRHELGMMPKDFDPKTMDPANGLGLKTLAAIDEASSGDRELSRYNLNMAWTLYRQYEAAGMTDKIEIDEVVAKRILDGDG